MGETQTRGRPRAFDRDAALAKATELFRRHGYEAVSIAELTAAMGIRPPSLYAAFGDKRRLFDEVVERYRDHYGALIEVAFAEPTAHRALEAFLRVHADDYTDASHAPGCLIISAAVNCTPAAADIEEKLRLQREAGKRALAERVEADVRAGLLPEDTDAHAIGTYVATVLQGMSTQSRDGATREELHAVVDLAMRALPLE